jgi:protein TonB
MANTAIVPPEIDPGKEPVALQPASEVHLTGDLAEKDEGVFGSLVSNLRDAFFPVKQPPLVLESKPVPVIDRMAVKQDPKSAAISTAVNVAIVALVVWWGVHKVVQITKPPVQLIALDAPPPPAPIKKVTMGGGGGQKGPTPVTKGTPPKFAPEQILPPVAPPTIKPKLAVDPTINVQTDLKMAKSDVPQIGMANSPLVGMSMGNGNGSGLGGGSGNGMGPGSNGNTGGGVYRIGGGVSAPVALERPEPEYSEEGRKAKVNGIVLVGMLIGADGKPSHVHVVRGLGMGLDEKALEAVSKWRFKPAMKDGKPVAVELNVEVDFQIY